MTASVKKGVVKKPRTHPSYAEMVKEAILALKERTGSSQIAIGKYIEDNNKGLPPNFKKLLLGQLKKLVAAGKLTKVKHSFKLSVIENSKPVAAKKAPVKARKVATPVKAKKMMKKPTMKVAKTATVTSPGKKGVAKKTAVAAKVKKTPVKRGVKKPKSIKSPVKKVVIFLEKEKSQTRLGCLD